MNISSATAQEVPDLLKALKLYQIQLSKDLQLIEKTQDHTEYQKKVHISLGDQQSHYLQVLQRPSTERRLRGPWFLDFSKTFLNTGTTVETFQQFGKQDSFRDFCSIDEFSY